MLLRKGWKIRGRLLILSLQVTGQARDEGVLHGRSLKEDRALEVDSDFERHGWRGCSRSLIIDLERRVHDLKCSEIRTLQMWVCKLHHWKLITDVCILNRGEVFIKQSRENYL